MQSIQEALNDEAKKFGSRAAIALDLLEVSLDSLAVMNLLSEASVCIDAFSDEGKHIVKKYTLGTKARSKAGEEMPYIKHSELVEDE